MCGPRKCPWHRLHKRGRLFGIDEVVPQGGCPWLYNSVYPYFLGLLYGARFGWNEKGDCNACCPAASGVDVIVRKRDNDGSFDSRIPADMKYVIFAEVVAVHRPCPYGHVVGERIPFPTCMVRYFLCPAAFHNAFPLMRLKPPPCIDLAEVRCPDWNDVITFDLRGRKRPRRK